MRILLSIGLVWLVAVPITTSAAPIAFSSQASGDWDADAGAGGTWTPDAGDHFYPVAGDTVTFNAFGVTVAAPATFSGGSISVSQNPFLTLNSTLTLDSGTFTYDGGSGLVLVNGNGSGLWDNDGTVIHDSSQTFYWDPPAIFQNDGSMNFTGGGLWWMRGSPASIDNVGTISASASGGRIRGDSGKVLNNSGAIVADGAELRLSVGLIDSGGTVTATNGGTIHFDNVAAPSLPM